MVDATQFENLELYRDPNCADRFIARDPSDGSLYAIPFEEIETTDATVTNNLTVNNKTTTDTLEATTMTIGDGDPVQDIEFGDVSLSGPAAASDASWDTNQLNQKTVSFDNTFPTQPSVVAGLFDPGFPGLQTTVDAITTTDFRVSVRNFSTQDRSSETVSVYWVAVA